MRADKYQIMLILAGILVTALFGVFLYREIFPEYKIYQKDYVALEEFRSTYTNQPPSSFQFGIKQIVIEREDRGPPVIDRCTSCHVALQIPYFSSTKIAYDLNGNIRRTPNGRPVLIPNEEYIWGKLDQKIDELRDTPVIEQLTQEGKTDEVKARLKQAKSYEALKTASVGEHTYDVTKVLAMHPLIGQETRPFEFHPIEEYGCVTCHNGNGRGLTTSKAHGPVYDEQYEGEYRGAIPQFIDQDEANDPPFAHIFNSKPSEELLFQTAPLFVGSLIQAKCVQCHQTSDMQLETVQMSSAEIIQRKQKQFNHIQTSFEQDKQALADLLDINQKIEQEGYAKTVQALKQRQKMGVLSSEQLARTSSQLHYIESFAKKYPVEENAKAAALKELNQAIVTLLGSQALAQQLQQAYQQKGNQEIDLFLKQHRSNSQATGTLFIKANEMAYQQDLLQHVEDNKSSTQSLVQNEKAATALETDIDDLTRNYQRGKDLYLSQACYACHRIAGLARGGVGPELTLIGTQYPWYIKESIVWPQADLANSTMPNMRLDHRELEDLMVFLLAQQGQNQVLSSKNYKSTIQSWEAGRKLQWEKPISPVQMHDLRYAMTVFATEGCAACHRLMGFDSNVGFKIEKNPTHTFDQLYNEQQWFKKLFPEVIRISQYDQEVPGATIAAQIEKHAQEIDERIVLGVREGAILEEINQQHPEAIESLYSNFRHASRAKDHLYQTLIEEEKDEQNKTKLQAEHQAWKERVHRVLMVYIQQYGFGRLIGPRPNWSGVLRSDEWLMEHFRNPSAHVPRSIMPVMPFDETKYYALTFMLDRLGARNRDAVRQIWENRGFDPAEAYAIHCVQCHGISHGGNGIVAEWIYPIPKSLRNPDFLRNLTRERAVYSILHGVKGTPMAPWGEIGQDKSEEIQKLIHGQPVLTEKEARRLVDWIFSHLIGAEVIREASDVPKWHYSPEDVLDELIKEGGHLESLPPEQMDESKQEQRNLPEKDLPQENVPPPADESVISFFPTGEGYYAAIRPEIYPKTLPKGTQQTTTVEEVFDSRPSHAEEGETFNYYIKKKYYTPFNLEQGQKFFLINCAVCHGNEGDGGGSRSSAMQDAKPRMLNNLDWVQSRDDLRLLRSIKYGVHGTSMTPWGDFTSSLQRLQLVMFIRSLTQERGERNQLETLLYQVFESGSLILENARISLYEAIQKQQQTLQELKERQLKLDKQAKEDKELARQAVENYEKILAIQEELNQLLKQDQKFLDLSKEFKREYTIYSNLGVTLISKGGSNRLIESLLQLIKLNENRYALEKGHLQIHLDPQIFEQLRQKRQQIIQELDQMITALNQRKKIAEGKITSAERSQMLDTIQADLLSYQKIRTQVLTATEDAIQAADKQLQIYKNLNQKLTQEPSPIEQEVH